MKTAAVLLLLILISFEAWAQNAKSGKGLLPELKLDKENEELNQTKAVQSEVLIAKSEEKALKALQTVIKKKKGTPSEPDLWNRLAELYMRRAKTGRFFDLTRTAADSSARFAPPEVREESALSNLKMAVSIYAKIEKEFPNFKEMDAVLFNAAFASQQIGKKLEAERLYSTLIEKHPKSFFIADAHLAFGELLYDQGKFEKSLPQFKAIEKYPAARVYSYGLYKQAWTHYNLHQNDPAIDKLIEVAKFWDPKKTDRPRGAHNLRNEALRDLTLFFGEARTPEEAYSFFKSVCNEEELGEILVTMGKLFDSHSRNKEMNIFLTQFVKNHPTSKDRIKAEMLLIQSYENLKDRKNVVAHLESAGEACGNAGEWRMQNLTISEAECDFDLGKVTVEIAKKWWEIWLKNKTNSEMAALTETAFRIHITRENPLKPDAKAHYAYAELLFQQEKYREASAEYRFSAEKSSDTTIAHDAAYSAIVSLEKAHQKSSKSTDTVELKTLCESYLTKFPKGSEVNQVQYKVGFIAYEDKDYPTAQKYLRPLATQKSGDESLKTRSQDLILDILNAQEDLDGVHAFAKQISIETSKPERKQNLTKIMNEAGYASVQKLVKNSDPSVGIQKLVAFSEEHQDSPLAKDSLWQAVALAYSQKRPIQGAELSMKYAKLYPTDSKTVQGLKDAAKHYTEQGFLTKASSALQILALHVKPEEQHKLLEAVAEIYSLENKKAEARDFYNKLLASATKDNQGALYAKLLATYSGDESNPEYTKIENKILSLKIEPTASEIGLKRLTQTFKQKKYTEAFNSAKNLVGSSAPAHVRAGARLIQAKVLEQELVIQSTKTTVDRLSLVLSIKTEKLDKAQQGFLAAASYSPDPNVQLETLEGLARIYKNYVETVGSPIIKTNLTPEEKQALQSELTALVTPIQKKQLDIEAKLKTLAKNEKTQTKQSLDFANLPYSETVKPQIPALEYGNFGFYLPNLTQEEGLFVERGKNLTSAVCPDSGSIQKLDSLSALMTAAGACIEQKKISQVEPLVLKIAERTPETGLAPYYLSVLALQMGLAEKAGYLIDLALKKNDDKSFFWYQKALALGHQKDFAGANQWMIKSFDERLDSIETKIAHGIVAFSQGDCFSVTDDFTGLDRTYLQRFGLTAALTECHAQKGEIDQALKIIETDLQKSKSLALALQWGHVAEVYKSDSAMAIKAYGLAQKMTTDTATLDWLTNKLKWLQNPTSVTSTDSLHVGSQVARGDVTRGGQ